MRPTVKIKLQQISRMTAADRETKGRDVRFPPLRSLEPKLAHLQMINERIDRKANMIGRDKIAQHY